MIVILVFFMTEITVGKVKTVYDVDGDAQKVLIKFHDKVTAVSYTHLTMPTKA